MVVDVIIPALDEEAAIGQVIAEIQDPRVRRIIVADNGSVDATAERAREAGAIVVREPIKGYGRACLTALAYVGTDPPDVVVFVDGDLADDASQMPKLLASIAAGADLVIGSRALGQSERGALTPVQVFGNWLSTRLIERLYGERFTDLGPFRAVRWEALERLEMRDQNFGWTVEMQVRAAKRALRCTEVPVNYRRRVGVSKVSGTIKGSVMAGTIILSTIARERLRD